MIRVRGHFVCALLSVLCACEWERASAEPLARVAFNNPGLVVDLGVGLWAWPLPMDYDRDGDYDLVVVCPDVPFNGTYFFENPGGDTKMPVFKPAVRIDKGFANAQLSLVGGQPRVLAPGMEYAGFREHGLSRPRRLGVGANVHGGPVRANQWKLADFDGDGLLDLVVGVGDWSEYGWDNAFDAQGDWTRGPLHGYLYWLRNTGTPQEPRYAEKVQLEAAGKPIDVFGMPSPNLADFDGDGDLDLLCGEFLDGFTYFENTGTRNQPGYASGRRLMTDDEPLHMDLQMITPVALDWDRDGDADLIVGDEDGRVAFVENAGKLRQGTPQFLAPRYFQQQAGDVKFGALVTPVSFDWDADGDEDLICGNTAGYIGWLENLDGGNPPRWAAPRYLSASPAAAASSETRPRRPGDVIRITAGPNGSIQGPCEAKWGYTTLSVADWDQDGLPDLVVNSIWGKVVWLRNVGQPHEPRLAQAEPLRVAWDGPPPKPAWNWWEPAGSELVTQWRTTPAVIDLDTDGLSDLVMLDHEGFLAFYRRARRQSELVLLPPRRIFWMAGVPNFDSRHEPQMPGDGPLRLNTGLAGRSGRRKFCFADWDQDGRLDLLVNSRNVNWLQCVAETPDGGLRFRDQGAICDDRLAGHTTSPTVVDWDRNGWPDLVVGGEDGHLYFLKNPAAPSGP